jgi:hypothetical protein
MSLYKLISDKYKTGELNLYIFLSSLEIIWLPFQITGQRRDKVIPEYYNAHSCMLNTMENVHDTHYREFVSY